MPSPAPIERIKGKYRYILTLRGEITAALRKELKILCLHTKHPKNLDLHVDMDALTMT